MKNLRRARRSRIDVRDIISYMIAFDTEEYNSTNQPLISYKDKRACLKHFQAHERRLRKLYPLLPDILRMWDEIHLGWRNWYNKGRSEESGHEIDGRFGKLTAVSPAPEAMYFRGIDAEWRMPEAYKYPILSAMRAAIRVHGKAAQWATDPFELLKSCRRAARPPSSVTASAQQITRTRSGKTLAYVVELLPGGDQSPCRARSPIRRKRKIKELEAQLAEFKRVAK